MIIGIDLGTTHSLVSVWKDGESVVIPNVLGKFLTPSVVSVDDNSELIVGEPALQRIVTHPHLTAQNFKRFMGSEKSYKLGEYVFRPEELSAIILKRLKEDAECYLGEEVNEAIISVPAYFSDAQRKATKNAGKLAGLRVERLISEPTAAGIAYGIHDNSDETNYLIVDLGGGTFDVSVLNLFSGIIEVRASCGDNHLGGVDFTKAIEAAFLKHIETSSGFALSDISLGEMKKIEEQAEIAKKKLSSTDSATMSVILNDKCFNYEITNQEFDNLTVELVGRIKEQIIKALNDAKIRPSEINEVVLVGGASRMMMLKRLVSRMLGRLPLSHKDPDKVVAEGVGVQAALKARSLDLNEYVVTDVAPYSLGIAVTSYKNAREPAVSHFDPIIERNVVVPVSRSRIYHPIHESQKMVNIEIYQGESFYLEKNIHLGDLSVKLPEGLKDRSVEVRFTYDINGLLEVDVTLIETKERKSIVLEGNPGILSEAEIDKRLNELKKIKIHPREETENKLALSLLERAYEDAKGELRGKFGLMIEEFISCLNRQELREILRFRKVIYDVIDKNPAL